jgi:hypothetical protein
MSPAAIARLQSARDDDPTDVWEWYQFQRQILGEELSRAIALLSNSSGALEHRAERYFGKSHDELIELFAAQTRELDLLTMLGMLAATEGRLQRDCFSRVHQRLKDAVSREFRRANKRRVRHRQRLSLEEDILRVWKDNCSHASAKNAINDFQSLLSVRHWLAHGRFWLGKFGRGYDAQDVHVICSNLLQVLGI